MHLGNSPEINIYKWINFFDTVFTGNVQHTACMAKYIHGQVKNHIQSILEREKYFEITQ